MQAERACNEGMRDISAIDLVKEIKSDGIWEYFGCSYRDCLGKSKDNQGNDRKGKGNGFNAVRVPVTWDTHIGPAPDYKLTKHG